MSSEDIPAASKIYRPEYITLYGIKLNDISVNATIPFDNKTLSLEVRKANPLPPREIAIVVTYGYSFEGHCYRFDRPKIFVFDGFEEVKEASGCGFGADYSMWHISSKQILLELSTRTDEAEVLVLEANLPGNRAPNTYGNSYQLAHRSGRLNRQGNT